MSLIFWEIFAIIVEFVWRSKQAALRVNDNLSKITQLREEQEECESKLEKERDIWAAEMFELIAEEDNMANCVINYIRYQQSYYKSALYDIEDVMRHVNGLISKSIDMPSMRSRVESVPTQHEQFIIIFDVMRFKCVCRSFLSFFFFFSCARRGQQ